MRPRVFPHSQNYVVFWLLCKLAIYGLCFGAACSVLAGCCPVGSTSLKVDQDTYDAVSPHYRKYLR